MAYIDSNLNDPSLFFNTVLYTGNGSTQSITGVGFSPSFVWIKSRNDTNEHYLFDIIRGVHEPLIGSANTAETTDIRTITSFDSDGFSMSDNTGINGSSDTEVAWNWKAGGSASSNSNGSITSSVSANTTAGFSIVSYTGTGANATIGHGLGVAPKMIITKGRSFADDWLCYHSSLGNGKYIILNKTNAEASSTLPWNSTSPTSSVFSVGSSGTTNNNGGTIIAYCFAEKKGYSKFGSYTGNGNVDGTFIHTSFRPAWLMIKPTSINNESWKIYDNKRNTFNVSQTTLNASDYSVEGSSSGNNIDILSNGFKIRSNDSRINSSGATNIYIAFAESPFVNSNGVPNNAR